jgi:hypothetical protein
MDQWEDLLKKSSVASFFQTPECYRFYQSLSFLECFLYGVSENGKLVGIACGYIISDGNRIKQYFSRRAIIPGGLLLDKDISSGALKDLLEKILLDLSKRVIYIEIRNYNDYKKEISVFEQTGFMYSAHLNFKIELKDEVSTFHAFNKTRQRQIRSAEKNGVVWTETTHEKEIEEFYSILKHLYKAKIKRPLFPREFFSKLAVLPHGRLLVVKRNGKITGGMACVFHNKVAYEWYVCGSDEEKQSYSSVMATWAGIQYAIRKNASTFDFMGAGKPGEDYGVRDFKRTFGGELIENGRFQYICNWSLYKLGSFVIKKNNCINWNS